MAQMSLSENPMSTSVPELQSASNQEAIQSIYMDRLAALAEQHDWSLNETLRRALDLTEVVLDVEKDPTAQVFFYRDGKRYSLRIQK